MPRSNRLVGIVVAFGVGAAALVVARNRHVFGPPVAKSKIVSQIRAAEQHGRSLPSDNQKSQFFNGLREVSKVVAAASVEDLDYVVTEAVRGKRVDYDFVVLYELVGRGDKARIVEFLSHVDWGELGWGDFWHQDIEWNLAENFPAKVPFEGLEVLFDAADATKNGEIRKHLMSRIKFSLGPRALSGVQDSEVIHVGRKWLAENRDQMELNLRYPSFMDGGGPMGGCNFGEPGAVYLLRVKGEAITSRSAPVPTR